MRPSSPAFSIRPVNPADAFVWEQLRCALWPDGRADHATEIASFFAGTLDEPAAVLIAENDSHTAIALLELSIRTDIPGLEGQRTGYVEGLYIVPEARGGNIAGQLLQESRVWARKSDCTIVATDRAERIIVDRRYR